MEKILFRPKKLPIETGGVVIALLNKDDADRMDLHAGDRILVSSNGNKIAAILDIAYGKTIKRKEIGLFHEGYLALKVTSKSRVKIALAEKHASIQYIKEKLSGGILSQAKINTIVKDIVDRKLSDVELAYFVAAYFTEGSTIEESINLTKAIADCGKKIKFNKKVILDKHCIGGVPNNRTTMILVPILASLGYTIPKTSSRSITSPAGTADTMETLVHVNLDVKEIKKVVKEHNACIVWGGGIDIASADDRLIKVRHSLSLDPEGMMLSSIMAKKYAMSSTHVIIDITLGKGAKIESKKEAEALKRKFEKIGKGLGMKMVVIITDGSQPIGNGIGPALECLDVIKVLTKCPGYPKDLASKSLHMSAKLLSSVEKISYQTALKRCQEVLDSGLAFEKFAEICFAQGLKFKSNKNNFEDRVIRYLERKKGSFFAEVEAPKSGKIIRINNRTISRIARYAGAPRDIGAGIYIFNKVGASVNKGDFLYRVYADNRQKLKFAQRLFEQDCGYEIK